MTQLGISVLPRRRSAAILAIRGRLSERSQSLAEAIAERKLYFRVSVVGTCNLSCVFCHNEGAPTRGKINLAVVDRAITAAVKVGFTRVQFTGGEPLLRPDIGDFVQVARQHVSDVGVTTNGTYLPVRLDSLVEAGLRRLHVSLQTGPLEEAGRNGAWGIPDWLMPTVERAASGSFNLRFNLPVPAHCLSQAEDFLAQLISRGIDVKVFSVLPEGDLREEDYPVAQLERMVERLNTVSGEVTGAKGIVFIRGFRPPAGIRCSSCRAASYCKEQSHSLRLGADLRLRPCLASREWDSQLPISDPESSIAEAALLALDYRW